MRVRTGRFTGSQTLRRQRSPSVGRQLRWRPFPKVGPGFTRLSLSGGQSPGMPSHSACRASPQYLVTRCSALPGQPYGYTTGTMASADSCLSFPHRCRCGSPILAAERQVSRDKHPFCRPLPGLPQAGLGSHGFRCLRPVHPPPGAYYPVSVRPVVAVAPASVRPRLTATPLPSLNGPDSLGRRGLPPPRTGTCPAYRRERLAGARLSLESAMVNVIRVIWRPSPACPPCV